MGYNALEGFHKVNRIIERAWTERGTSGIIAYGEKDPDTTTHSDIAPAFTVGSFWCRLSNFTIKHRGYLTQATAPQDQNLRV